MSVYYFGSIVGEVLKVHVLGVKIAAGMIEWGLFLGAVAFVMNIIFTTMGHHSIKGRMADFSRVVLTAPIIEEVIYRLVLISAFTYLFDSIIFAVVLSALLFALGHLLYGGMTFIDCFITGLIWGWAFLNLGLGVTIIAHIFHNFMVSVLS